MPSRASLLLNSLSLDSLKLVSLLLQILSQLLLADGDAITALPVGIREVTTITTLYIYDIVLISKTDNILLQNNFHSSLSSLNYFIKSVT